MTASSSATAIVLAAGEGTRMRSPLPKVLHAVGGRPMLAHVLDAVGAMAVPPRPVVVVVGREPEAVRAAARRDAPATLAADLVFVTQTERLGTGHAVMQARSAAAGRAPAVLVLYGDVPLIKTTTLEGLLRAHAAARPAVTMLTTVVDAPGGYGRVVRAAPEGGPAREKVGGAGSVTTGDKRTEPGPERVDVTTGGDAHDARGARVARVVEEKDATPGEKAVNEINAGIYVFDDAWLWPVLAGLCPSAGGEIYLTGVIGCAVAEGRVVEAVVAADPSEVAGVNTVDELARAEAVLLARSPRPAFSATANSPASPDTGTASSPAPSITKTAHSPAPPVTGSADALAPMTARSAGSPGAVWSPATGTPTP